MTAWRRLSARRGVAADEGAYDGVPPHAQGPIEHWVRGMFGWFDSGGGGVQRSHQLMLQVASMARIPMNYHSDATKTFTLLMAKCRDNGDLYLNVLDAVLHQTRGSKAAALRDILDTAGSKWTVAANGQSLEEAVDPTMLGLFKEAVSPNDLASSELAEAWARAFSRSPDASDAWDHAAKAVEAALIPLVVPRQDSPHLGHALGELRKNANRWRLAVPGPQKDHGIQLLIDQLDSMWPNPDRHASDQRRVPDLDESRAVVQLAVLVVQWIRSGVLRSTTVSSASRP